MKPVTTFVVTPEMSPALAPLKELAYNYWWCWNKPAIELFRSIDPKLWENVGRNPVALLSNLPPEKLSELSESSDFMNKLESVYGTFRAYMDGSGWYETLDHGPSSYIAYFCAEFGIHESFSSYSGGLGVLAGDHLKSASDLGLPLMGVGLLYQEGYFRQYLTQNGWQNEQYQEVDFHNLPTTLVTTSDGKPLMVSVDMPKGKCHAQIWRVNVGRVPLYLLDTNVAENTDPELQRVSDRLYGGDVHTRVMQEMMLGIGGVRALRALGIEPSVGHINEGHAAFSLLERTFDFMNRFGLTFKEAWRVTAGSTVFTTHTPVPAGNEVFDHELLRPYFEPYIASIGISWEEFVSLGAKEEDPEGAGFSMTVLGLKGSSFRNGVSQLHGRVAREMWRNVWPDFTLNEVPISGVTNGVHTATWVGSEIADLYDKHLGAQWRTEPHVEGSWDKVHDIPNDELWAVHSNRRKRLVLGAREHILSKHHASLTAEQASRINDCLDPNILTIGFARRFATYKRADLLLSDMDRLARIIKNNDRPIQVILAGKAHPNDGHGKEMIQGVHQKIREYELEHRVVFLEDYDMDVARLMVRGCDIWLNTPRRPHEASGTSGMKAAVNGVMHFSVLDGWWAEAFDGTNGFAIGRGEEFDDAEQDAADSATLYDTIEHELLPMFYELDENGLPNRWIARMKNCIQTLSWRFSALRMVHDYTVEAYGDTMARYRTLVSDQAQAARDAVNFFDAVDHIWSDVRVSNVMVDGTAGAFVGKLIKVSAEVDLAGIQPSSVIVQAMHGRVDFKGEIAPATFVELQLADASNGKALYEGEYVCSESGMQGCTVRVLPTHHTLSELPDAQKATYANGIG